MNHDDEHNTMSAPGTHKATSPPVGIISLPCSLLGAISLYMTGTVVTGNSFGRDGEGLDEKSVY